MIGKTNTAFGVADPASVLGLVVTGYNGVYDKTSHTVTASVDPEYQSTTTFNYSTNSSTWSSSAPTRTDAGTTTVYVRAISLIVGIVTVETAITITPAPVTLTAGSLTTTYNRYGNAQSVNTYTCSVSGVRFASTVKASGSGTNVGEYPVKFSGVTIDVTTDTTGNYVVHELVEGKIVISKAAASELGLYVYNYSGDYDGSAHTVTANVSVTSGTTIQYSTNNSTWSNTAPTRTKVGSTKVYVRATNSNFETATATGTITIKEAKATLIVSWEAGKVCILQEPYPYGNVVFNDTSGYWSGNPEYTGTYVAFCPQSSVTQRSVNVTSTTSGTYYILW